MPMPDKMGLTFTPAEITTLHTHFTDILALINSKKVVQLTKDERQSALSISEKRLPYVQNAIDVLASDFVDLRPGFLPYADAVNDMQASSDLRALSSIRDEVNDRMIDFSMASEHFAYQYMRIFYNNAKQAQAVNTPGADTVVNALAPLFEGQGVPGGATPTP
jgi:hypothetical protein